MTKIEPQVAATPARAGLPVLPPLVAVLEIVVLMVVPAALDHFWPSFPTLSQMQPHFFWLPVLLLSLQYGTVSGLLAAGVAIVLTAWLGWAEQEVGENHFNYLLRISTQPMLWLVAALLLGQFRLRQIEQAQSLEREVAHLAAQRTSIADYAASLRSRCDTLERELACRSAAPSRVLLDALSAANAGRQALPDALQRCMEAAFAPCRASLYALEGDELVVAATYAAPAAAGEPMPQKPRLAATHPVLQAAVREGRALSILTPGDEATLAGVGLVAVPTVAPNDGPVTGLLVLEVADPADLDAETGGRLAVIANQLAAAMSATGQTTSRGHDAHQPRAKSGPRLRLWRQVKWRRLRHPAESGAYRSSRVG